MAFTDNKYVGQAIDCGWEMYAINEGSGSRSAWEGTCPHIDLGAEVVMNYKEMDHMEAHMNKGNIRQ